MMFLGLRKLGNICCGHKMFLNKIRNIFCVPDNIEKNVARAGKRGNICVRSNVSSFARAFTPCTTPKKFGNAALFLRLSLPSTQTCLVNRAGGICKRRLCVLVWMKIVLKTMKKLKLTLKLKTTKTNYVKTELFANDLVKTIKSRWSSRYSASWSQYLPSFLLMPLVRNYRKANWHV